jgi:hypothetical protein
MSGKRLKEAIMWAMKERGQQTEQDSENFTLLGRGVDFKGVVNFEGTVRVDGRVEGEIHTTGTLIVGEHAVIEGIVSAGVLMRVLTSMACATWALIIGVTKAPYRLTGLMILLRPLVSLNEQPP